MYKKRPEIDSDRICIVALNPLFPYRDSTPRRTGSPMRQSCNCSLQTQQVIMRNITNFGGLSFSIASLLLKLFYGLINSAPLPHRKVRSYSLVFHSLHYYFFPVNAAPNSVPRSLLRLYHHSKLSKETTAVIINKIIQTNKCTFSLALVTKKHFGIQAGARKRRETLLWIFTRWIGRNYWRRYKLIRLTG